jgi:outer membrane biosynthesis protein TonB
MRSLATLGGLLVLIVLAIAWKISNQVEAGQEPDTKPGRITLGVHPDDLQEGDSAAKRTPASTENGGSAAGAQATKTTPASKPAETPAAPPATAPKKPQPQPEPSKPLAQPQAEPPAQPATPTAEDQIEGLRYTVKEGDTLYGILSRAYGKANQALIDSVAVASELDDPSRLSPGMVLVLPQVPGFNAPKRP